LIKKQPLISKKNKKKVAMLEDTYRHKGMRRDLIAELRQKGITNELVLEAFWRTPRHFFLDKAFEELAYQDQALPLEAAQTISQPYTVAFQTQLLDVQPKQKVLEIGTGSGFQAAILSVLGARVYTIERQEILYKSVTELFEKIQLPQIRVYFKDGFIGLGEFAPFDRILVTAAVEAVPPSLLSQLALGGILVIPVGDEQGQTMQRITKVSEQEYQTEMLSLFRFVPLLRGKNYE
jgi:protein-L-isoaspartate(D-aspartate) O-methyltransferase